LFVAVLLYRGLLLPSGFLRVQVFKALDPDYEGQSVIRWAYASTVVAGVQPPVAALNFLIRGYTMLKEIVFILIFTTNNGFPLVIEGFASKNDCTDFAIELMTLTAFLDGEFICIKKKAR